MLFAGWEVTFVFCDKNIENDFKCFQYTHLLTYHFFHKVRYPDRITLIRGNHESRQITQVGFSFTAARAIIVDKQCTHCSLFFVDSIG